MLRHSSPFLLTAHRAEPHGRVIMTEQCRSMPTRFGSEYSVNATSSHPKRWESSVTLAAVSCVFDTTSIYKKMERIVHATSHAAIAADVEADARRCGFSGGSNKRGAAPQSIAAPFANIAEHDAAGTAGDADPRRAATDRNVTGVTFRNAINGVAPAALLAALLNSLSAVGASL